MSVVDIPKLILMDEKCGQITTEGYACVGSDPSGEVSNFKN